MALGRMSVLALFLEVARLSGAVGAAGAAEGQQLQPGSLVIVSHLSGAAQAGGFGAPAVGLSALLSALALQVCCCAPARAFCAPASPRSRVAHPARAVRHRDHQGVC